MKKGPALYLAIGTIIALGGLFSYADAQSTTACSFSRNLYEGLIGSDVQCLQSYLNSHGFELASAGPGSPGNETDHFGPLMQNAVETWRRANGISSTGYFGPISREKFAASAELSAGSTPSSMTTPQIQTPQLPTSDSTTRMPVTLTQFVCSNTYNASVNGAIYTVTENKTSGNFAIVDSNGHAVYDLRTLAQIAKVVYVRDNILSALNTDLDGVEGPQNLLYGTKMGQTILGVLPSIAAGALFPNLIGTLTIRELKSFLDEGQSVDTYLAIIGLSDLDAAQSDYGHIANLDANNCQSVLDPQAAQQIAILYFDARKHDIPAISLINNLYQLGTANPFFEDLTSLGTGLGSGFVNTPDSILDGDNSALVTTARRRRGTADWRLYCLA